MAKILVGVVTGKQDHHCLDEFADALKRQTVKADVLAVLPEGQDAYAKLVKSKGFEVVHAENAVAARKRLRERALKDDYEYVLFLSGDIILTDHRAVEVLALLKAAVVTGLYLNVFELGGKKVIAPVLFKDLGNGECQLYTYEGAAAPKIMKIGAGGLGCVMVSRKALEQVDFREQNHEVGFYLDVRGKGFMPVANTWVKCARRPFPKDDPRAKAFEWTKVVEDNTVELEWE